MDGYYFDIHLLIVSGRSVIFIVLIIVIVVDVQYDILTVLLRISLVTKSLTTSPKCTDRLHVPQQEQDHRLHQDRHWLLWPDALVTQLSVPFTCLSFCALCVAVA
jgi:hypothetical protein